MSAKALAVTALILLGVSMLIGFIPVSSQGANCGSAFAQSSDAKVADYSRAMRADSYGAGLDSLSPTSDACDSLRSVVRIPAIVLLAVGAAVLLAAGVVNNRRGPLATSGSSKDS